MAKFKQILSVIMVCAIGASALGACGGGETAEKPSEEPQSLSNELKIVKSGLEVAPEDRLAHIKSEYLIENQGYKDEDEVVAILSLNGEAISDSYFADEAASEKMSLGAYAATQTAQAVKRDIDYEQTDLLRALSSKGLTLTVNYRYSVLTNAVAVTTTYGDFLEMEQFPAVKSATLAETYLKPQEAEGTDASAIVNDVDVYETGIFNAESAVDPQGNPYTGKTTSVAVLDSGFDLSHPAFNTYRLDPDTLMFDETKIADFLKKTDTDGKTAVNAVETTPDLTVSDVYYSDKIPFHYDYADKDPDVMPYDSEHGTHVAGIIGGYADSYQDKDGKTVTDSEGKNVPFQGIAKDTQLVLMKVFPNLSAGAETEDILAALEDAVLLEVDAINMSLGAACGFAREKDGDLVNEVYDKINQSGVNLVTAASNMYSSGFGGAQGNTNFVTNPDSGTVGSPASYPPALSVASIDGIKSKYIVGNDSQVFFFNESNNMAGEENDLYGELYAKMGWSTTDNATHTLDYVTVPGYGYNANYNGINVEGKVALISRGDSTFEQKAEQAMKHGAVACIIYNNLDGDILMSMGKSDHIPTISISKEDGTMLAQRRTGTLTFGYGQQAGPFMSDFSSWGPLPDLTLKPEITAHGGNITSSVPGGGYDQISGTSMACPNLCGIVVLIRQFIKDQERYSEMTWKQISVLTNQMLMSTATIILNEQGNPYSPRKQGAGLASLYNVVNTKAYLTVDGKDRSKIELYDDPEKKGVYEMEFNVVNTSAETLRYELGLVGMTESVSTADSDHVAERGQLLSGGFKAEVVGGEGSVSGTSVTVNGNSTLKLKVTYTLSDEDKDTIESLFPYGMYVEGFVKLMAEGEEIDLNIPFLAFYGDWTQAPIFDKTYFEVESEAHNAGIDEEDKLKADYYATTPYGSFFYNYIIPLGTYLYDIDESAYDPIPASLDRIAISNELNKIDGISTVYAGLLRGCKRVNYTITDKLTGEEVYSFENINAHKAYSQGGSPIPNYEFLRISAAQLGLVNNREYTFKMVGELDYQRDGVACPGLDTNVRNTFAFDFALDTEAPIIKSATYEKEYDRSQKKDRYYVNLTIYDNQYAMSVYPMLFGVDTDDSGRSLLKPYYLTKMPVPIYSEKGQDSTVRIEITDFLENVEFDELMCGQIGFSVEDYALNSNIYMCTLPGTRGELKFTEDGNPDSGEMRNNQTELEVGEVLDLTHYLSTTDPTVDENKDYLRYLVWTSQNTRVAEVKDGLVLGKLGSPAGSPVTITASVVLNDTVVASASVMLSVYPKSGALSASGGDNTVVPLSQNNVDDVNNASIKSIRLAYFDTLFAHARAGQPTDIGDTGDRTFFTSTGSAISMYPGESIQLHYDLDPWYVADRYHYVFSSADDSYVTVTEDGILTAIKEGTTTISLKERDGKSNLMATLTITVKSEFIIDDMRTLVAYKGTGGDVVVPDDEGILYIGPYAFSLFETNYSYAQELPDDDLYANRIPSVNSSIRSVVIPEGVSEIQQHAFYECTALESVTLPESCKFLRQNVFYHCTSLKEINLNHVEVIAANCFEGCSKLTSLMEKESASSEGRVWEENNQLHAYTIGVNGFKDCSALQKVDLTNLRNAGESCFEGCKSLTSVTLGENSKLARRMFYGCAFESIDIYEKNIVPAYAFAGNTALNTVNFASEKGLNVIQESAFAGDTALQTVTLPNSAFTLGGNVFDGCTSLTTVKLKPNTRLSDAQGALFTGTGVTTFEIEGTNSAYTVSSDGHQLLGDSGKTIVLAGIKYYTGEHSELTVPASVSRIAGSAFAGAELTSVVFQGPIEVSAYAFANCKKLTSVSFAATGTSTVGTRAFNHCDLLDTVTNLDKLSAIGDYAFASCAKLESATIGEGATVGSGAFLLTGLKTLTLGANTKLIDGAFQRCTSLATVYMPASGGVSIGATCFWSDTALSTIDLTKAAGELGNQAFFGCSALRSADLSNITKIGDMAFANCGNLTSVTLSNDLESIGEGAFMDYDSYNSTRPTFEDGPKFTEITLPQGLRSIGSSAFFGCTALRTITIPDGITEIGDYTFAECSALTEVVLPESVKKLGDYAFTSCDMLQSINLGHVEEFGEYLLTSSGRHQSEYGEVYELQGKQIDLTSAKKIGFGAFADTRVGGDIQAPDLTEIGAAAFQNAYFTSFTAPKLESIGDIAFDGNSKLTGFAFSEAIKYVGTVAFRGCSALTDYTFKGEKSGKVNDYALLDDGILYTTMQSGKLQLSSVPAGKNIATLEVLEGTARVDNFAGNENTHVGTIILPDSLESIGNYAFYGYAGTLTVEFRSVTAPKLESAYDSSAVLSESDPGYKYLHDQQDLDTLTNVNNELGYYNFVGLLGKNNPLKWRLPANADLSGYDSLVYLVYFGPVATATRTEYVAMEQNLKDFLGYAEKISALGQKVTMADEELISAAVRTLNAIKQDPTAYGYTAEEWNALTETVLKAHESFLRLRVSNAKKSVRDMQARIDALPDSYDGSAEQDALILALQEAIEELSTDDRSILILTKYTNLLSAYDAAHRPPVEGDDGNEGEGDGLGVGAIVGISVAAAVVVLGAAVAVTLILLKKRSAKSSQTSSEETPETEDAAKADQPETEQTETEQSENSDEE